MKMSNYRKINFDDVKAYKANMDGYEPTEHNEIETEDKLEEVYGNTMPEVEEFKMTEREIEKIKSTFTSMTEDEMDIVLSLRITMRLLFFSFPPLFIPS